MLNKETFFNMPRIKLTNVYATQLHVLYQLSVLINSDEKWLKLHLNGLWPYSQTESILKMS